MNHDPTSMLREGLAAWNRGDLEAVLEMLDPDVRIRTSGAFPGLGPEYRGHQGFREFWREMRDMWAELAIELEGVERIDDLMLSALRYRGRGRNGIEVESLFHFLWEFDEDGEKVIAYRSFSERDEAVNAAQESHQKGGLPT